MFRSSPDFGIGVIYELFHLDGICLVDRDLLNSNSRGFANASMHFFRTLEGTLSGPELLLDFIRLICSINSSCDTRMCESKTVSGSSSKKSWGSWELSYLYTDPKCFARRLKILYPSLTTVLSRNIEFGRLLIPLIWSIYFQNDLELKRISFLIFCIYLVWQISDFRKHTVRRLSNLNELCFSPQSTALILQNTIWHMHSMYCKSLSLLLWIQSHCVIFHRICQHFPLYYSNSKFYSRMSIEDEHLTNRNHLAESRILCGL